VKGTQYSFLYWLESKFCYGGTKAEAHEVVGSLVGIKYHAGIVHARSGRSRVQTAGQKQAKSCAAHSVNVSGSGESEAITNTKGGCEGKGVSFSEAA